MTKKLSIILVGLSVIALAAVPAGAECVISGMITAEMNTDDPDLGNWCYTMEVNWDTGDQYALSHLDLIVDLPGGTCECHEIASSINFASPSGSSDGYPDGCQVDYNAYVECDGDPSIPIDGILIKWEPIEMDPGCEPGPVGTGHFVFYSDYPPATVNDSLPLVAEKNGGENCAGFIDGVFPGLPCDPVSAEATTWSELKSRYAD